MRRTLVQNVILLSKVTAVRRLQSRQTAKQRLCVFFAAQRFDSTSEQFA